MTEINTGLTTAMEEYKFSQSSPYGFRRSSVAAGPSGTQYVHPQRQAAFGKSLSVSSPRDTGSEYSWHAQLTGGAGSNAGGADGGAAGGAEGGAAGGADGGAAGRVAGGGGAAGDPPPPPDPPPSDHGGAGWRRMSRRQRRIKELEFAKPIKIKVPKKLYGKAGEVFDTWWVLVQVYIEDQPEKFPKDERIIDWIGSLMDSYAASWHIQWLKGTLNGTHRKSMTGYVNALKLRFEDRDAKDEAYVDLERIRYEGCIHNMIIKIQTFNDKAMVTGAALNKLILERLPQKILEQMHVVDLTGKSDQEIITNITNAGRTAEKWEAVRKNLGLKASLRTHDKKQSKLERIREKPEKSERRKNKQGRSEKRRFKKHRPECNQDYSKTEGIDPSEFGRSKSAEEC